MFLEKIKKRWPNIEHIKGKGNGRESKEERERVTKESELDDKIIVRKHLEPLIGVDSLPKLYYSGPVEDCIFKDIPLPFVIKTRCQSGNCKVINSLDGNVIDMLRTFYKKAWSYRGMNNDVIIEEKLDVKCPNERFKNCDYHYELMTFGGKVKNIIYHVDINSNQKQVLPYYPDWKRNMLYSNSVLPMDVEIPKPENLDKLFEFGEKCAEYYCNYTTIPHVRISVYELKNGKYIFGEYTGATTGGGGGSTEYQKQMSNWWMESAPNTWLK